MNSTDLTKWLSLSGMDNNRKIQAGLIAILVMVAAGMYAWRVSSLSVAEDKIAEAEKQHLQARTQLLEQARQLDARNTEAGLRRFCTPLAWAIRREVMATNLDQVDQYFADLVQMSGFQSAVLAKPDGKIIVGSDRKQLARAFADLYPAQYLQAQDIQILPTAEGKLLVFIPIMGLSQNLGTVALEYLPVAYPLH